MKNKYRRGTGIVNKYILTTIMLLITMTSYASASGLSAISIGGDTQGTVGDFSTIYLNIEGADTVGSLQLDIMYNPKIIKANVVTAESISQGSIYAFNIDNTAGKVTIGMASTEGVTGSGPLVKINYSVIKAGNSVLDITGASATDISSKSFTIGSITGSSFHAIAKTSSGDILTYYRGLGQNPSAVETGDLLKAADDWRDNIIPQGFSVSVATNQLLALADEWRNS